MVEKSRELKRKKKKKTFSFFFVCFLLSFVKRTMGGVEDLESKFRRTLACRETTEIRLLLHAPHCLPPRNTVGEREATQISPARKNRYSRHEDCSGCS